MKKWLPEELEEIPCDFCGTREVAKQFIRKDGMRVVECAQCGLAYLNPRPKPEFIPRFYQADYFTGAAAERGEGGLKCNLDPTPIEQKPNSRVMEIVDEKFGGFWGKEVLEIGCATGDLLIQLKDVGARVRGLEISDFAANVARKRGLDVSTGTIESFVRRNSENFDIVLALEVIEHVLSLRRFIETVACVIKPGGVLLLSTPNYACAKRFGKEWYGFTASFEHIFFLDLRVLKKIANRCGLSICYWETSSYPGGPVDSQFFLNRLRFKIHYTLFLMNELGFTRGIDVLSKKLHYRFGVGHSLYAFFEKNRTISYGK